MSKKKTALMRAIEIADSEFQRLKSEGLNDWAIGFIIMKEKMVELLETEEQDSIYAFNDGFILACDVMAGIKNATPPPYVGERWFNEKYQSDGE